MTELGSGPRRPVGTAVRPRTPGRVPAPPPRPPLVSELAPPAPGRSRPADRRGAALGAAVPWFAGLAAALVGVVATAADGDELRARLTAEALAADPSASGQLVASGVRTTVLVVLGAQLLLALLAALWAALLLRRTAWARWLLLGTGLLVVVVTGLAQGVVAGGVDVDRMALLAEGALAVAGSVAVLTPPVGRWVRGRQG